MERVVAFTIAKSGALEHYRTFLRVVDTLEKIFSQFYKNPLAEGKR